MESSLGRCGTAVATRLGGRIIIRLLRPRGREVGWEVESSLGRCGQETTRPEGGIVDRSLRPRGRKELRRTRLLQLPVAAEGNQKQTAMRLCTILAATSVAESARYLVGIEEGGSRQLTESTRRGQFTNSTRRRR